MTITACWSITQALRLNDICSLLMIIISDIREAQLKMNIFLVSTPNGD